MLMVPQFIRSSKGSPPLWGMGTPNKMHRPARGDLVKEGEAIE